jgi:hypothetical protein
VAIGKTLSFSETDAPWEMPADYIIYFEDTITGVYPFNEAMIVTSRSDSFVIYGNLPDNFVVKKLDASGFLGINSGRIIGGNLYLTLAESTQITTTGSNEAITGIAIFDGARPTKISSKIDSLFPRLGWLQLVSPFGYTDEALTGTDQNRFLIVRYNDSPFGPTFVAGDAVATFSFLVLDTIGQGFMTADDSGAFAYRTREFPRPARAAYVRTCFVEFVGTLTVEVYMDGTLATTVTLTSTGRDTKWFNVKPYRFDYFSFRFTGASGTIVYAFGVTDPPTSVGVGG